MQECARRRVAPIWRPVWTPRLEQWTAKAIKKNLWRFDRIEGADDLMQEAQFLFHVLEKKYPIVNEMAHFVALYKTSLLRLFIDKSRKRRDSAIDQDVCAEDVIVALGAEGNMPNNGYLNLLLAEMPDELKILLRALTSKRLRLKLEKPTQTNCKIRKRENHNMRLKRRFALTTPDPVGDLRRYFANS